MIGVGHRILIHGRLIDQEPNLGRFSQYQWSTITRVPCIPIGRAISYVDVGGRRDAVGYAVHAQRPATPVGGHITVDLLQEHVAVEVHGIHPIAG